MHCKHDLTGGPEKLRGAKITIYAKGIFQNKNKQKRGFFMKDFFVSLYSTCTGMQQIFPNIIANDLL